MLLDAEEALFGRAFGDLARRLRRLAEITLLSIFLERHDGDYATSAPSLFRGREKTRDDDKHHAAPHRNRGHADKQVRDGHRFVEAGGAARQEIADRGSEEP